MACTLASLEYLVLEEADKLLELWSRRMTALLF